MPELNSDLFDDNFLIGYLKNELKKLDQEIFELNNKLNDKNKIYSNLKIELDKLEENLQKELLENNNFIS
jgi:predicted RNase H-like nuclease (RuvC/YqgF family)